MEGSEEIQALVKSGQPFAIKVITKSSCEKIYLENGILKVKVHAIPEDNKANKAIVELFAKTFKMPKSNIQIIAGLKASRKVIRITE
jgi:uncharacterized protein (TIGR00251 family)